jgi:hypothetical protein
MDPLKNAVGAIVLLFMLLGALDLFVVGAALTVSGIVNGPAAALIFGGILLTVGSILLVVFCRAVSR